MIIYKTYIYYKDGEPRVGTIQAVVNEATCGGPHRASHSCDTFLAQGLNDATTAERLAV
jgi:hypothetical protein